MLFSFPEIFDILITIVAAGYIFMDAFREPGHHAKTFGERFLFSVAIAGPAIVLHELGHKFVGLALGYTAVFHAAYLWLGLGVVLRLLAFPFLFLVPAYVSIVGPSGLPHAAVALAGPAINGILWLASAALLRWGKFTRTTEAVLYYSKIVNMFLFIFNMLPIPGFDGWNVYTNIF